MTQDRRRMLRALAIAPLCGPMAIFAVILLRATIEHAAVGQGPADSVASVVFFLWLFVLFGAPLAYAGSLAVLWPITIFLERAGLVRWWSLTGAAALGGAALLPFYKRFLLPRGTFDLFPGDGLVAGAAIGLTLWLLAFRARPSAN